MQKHAVDLDKITVILAVLHLSKARVHDLPAAKAVKFVHTILVHLKAARPDARTDGGIDFGITARPAQRSDRVWCDPARSSSPACVHRSYGKHTPVSIARFKQYGHAIRAFDSQGQATFKCHIAVRRALCGLDVSPACIRFGHGQHLCATHMQELLTGRTHFYVDERVICMQLQALSPEKKVLFIHTDTTQQHSSVGIELDYAGEHTAPTPTKTTRQPYRHADLIP